MEKVTVLRIDYNFGGMQDAIYPAVLKDETHMVLVDCGFVGFLPKIEQAMAEQGLDIRRLTHVIITHHDHDHMGALRALKDKYPAVRVLASEAEEPYISGRDEFLRLKQARARQPFLPEGQKAFGEAFIRLLESVMPVPVDQTLKDGDVLDFCGGVTVLHTPGHTPGHISLYVNAKKLLIAGDAAALEGGKPVIANPAFTLDMEKAESSMKRILAYGAQEILFYHGGLVNTQEWIWKDA